MSVRQRLKDEKAAASSETPFFPSRLHGFGALVAAVVGIVLYVQTLSYGFVYDDFPLIRDNKVTQQGFDAVFPSFAQPFRFDNMRGVDYLYRPLTKAVFCATWGVFGNNPAPFHALNVVLHAATAALIAAFVGHLLKGAPWVSCATALLFVAHPIHTEVVCNIKSLDEILALFFGLLGMIAWVRHRDAGRSGVPWAAVVAFAAALFSKESAVTYVAAFFVLDRVRTATDPSVMRRGWFALGLTIAFFLAARQAVLSTEKYLVSPADNALLAVDDFVAQKASAVAYLGLYLKLLVFPYPLSADYSIPQLPIFGVGDWQFLCSAAIWTCIVVAAIVAWRRRSLWTFAWVFLLATMSVSANLVFMIGTVFGERLAYSASFVVCLIFAWSTSRWLRPEDSIPRRGVYAALVVAIAVVGCGWSYLRSPVWKDFDVLRKDMLSTAPNSFRVQAYFAEWLIDPARIRDFSDEEKKAATEQAKTHLIRAAELYPRSDQAWTMLGDIERRAGNIPDATAYYEKALAAEHTHPFYAKALNNLGTFLAEKNRIDDAIALFQKAAKFEDSSSHAWSNLGKAWFVKGNMTEAAAAFRKAIAFDPKDPDALRFLPLIAQAAAGR